MCKCKLKSVVVGLLSKPKIIENSYCTPLQLPSFPFPCPPSKQVLPPWGGGELIVLPQGGVHLFQGGILPPLRGGWINPWLYYFSNTRHGSGVQKLVLLSRKLVQRRVQSVVRFFRDDCIANYCYTCAYDRPTFCKTVKNRRRYDKELRPTSLLFGLPEDTVWILPPYVGLCSTSLLLALSFSIRNNCW